jgi:hypothetical protein
MPSGDVREILERHREAEIEKKRLREEARRKRTHGSDAEAALAAETVL